MKVVALLSLAALAGCCACQAPGALPADVQSFIARRDNCDTLRGEVSGEARSAEEDRAAVDAINKACKGTDRELATLRGKYVDNDKVIQALSKYEFRIEAH
jgi:hypothetical protein